MPAAKLKYIHFLHRIEIDTGTSDIVKEFGALLDILLS
jgi:hypothetical protein